MSVKLRKAIPRDLAIPFGRNHRIPASADATTDIAEAVIFKDARASKSEGARAVEKITFTPDPGVTAVTASNTNKWTITVKKYAEGGTGAVTVGSIATTAAGTNGLAAMTTVTVPITAGALNPGDLVTVAVAHAATPNAVFPSGTLRLEVALPA